MTQPITICRSCRRIWYSFSQSDFVPNSHVCNKPWLKPDIQDVSDADLSIFKMFGQYPGGYLP